MAAEDRRQQILKIAVSLFSQRGFRGTTTKEIAHAAGVSEAIIFRHFATKEELYTAILDTLVCASGNDPFEVLNKAFEGGDSAVFERIAIEALHFHEHNPEFQRLLLHAALEGHELADLFWNNTVVQAYERLGNFIRKRQEDGVFRSMDPKIVVRCFIGMIIHHSLTNQIWDTERKLLNISNEEAARQFTRILLNGIRTEPDASDEGMGPTPSSLCTKSDAGKSNQ
jgi:AcrR family transcriptional regulator